ncbi:hypothetical protein O181_044515 [Austropuccinia psidii MF-1]|uniref:Uncharacterized protein n=1 Tax=Austropuccinia psidii MF-1 TaxID=1389203 RepID=A0A9Q3DPL6_9BASI|nr:hypothetical protein [Austropuccinia psidii MF-1]
MTETRILTNNNVHAKIVSVLGIAAILPLCIVAPVRPVLNDQNFHDLGTYHSDWLPYLGIPQVYDNQGGPSNINQPKSSDSVLPGYTLPSTFSGHISHEGSRFLRNKRVREVEFCSGDNERARFTPDKEEPKKLRLFGSDIPIPTSASDLEAQRSCGIRASPPELFTNYPTTVVNKRLAQTDDIPIYSNHLHKSLEPQEPELSFRSSHINANHFCAGGPSHFFDGGVSNDPPHQSSIDQYFSAIISNIAQKVEGMKPRKSTQAVHEGPLNIGNPLGREYVPVLQTKVSETGLIKSSVVFVRLGLPQEISFAERKEEFYAFIAPLCTTKISRSIRRTSALMCDQAFRKMKAPMNTKRGEEFAKPAVNLLTQILALSSRFQDVFRLRKAQKNFPEEDTHLCEFVFTNILTADFILSLIDDSISENTSKLSDVQLLIVSHFMSHDNEPAWTVKSQGLRKQEISKQTISEVEIASLSLLSYYQSTNQRKWKFFFGNKDRFIGFLAELKSFFERFHALKVSDLLGKMSGPRDVFPWRTKWELEPSNSSEKLKERYAPLIKIWWQTKADKYINSVEPILAKDKLVGEELEAQSQFGMPWIFQYIFLFVNTFHKQLAEKEEAYLEKSFQELEFRILSQAIELDVVQMWLPKNEHFEKKLKDLFLKIVYLNRPLLRILKSGITEDMILEQLGNLQKWIFERTLEITRRNLRFDSSTSTDDKKNIQFQHYHDYISELINAPQLQEKSNLGKGVSGGSSLLAEGSHKVQTVAAPGNDHEEAETRLAVRLLIDYYQNSNYFKWAEVFEPGGMDSRQFLDVLAYTIMHDCQRLVGYKASKEKIDFGDAKIFPWQNGLNEVDKQLTAKNNLRAYAWGQKAKEDFGKKNSKYEIWKSKVLQS